MNLKEYATSWFLRKAVASGRVSYCQVHLTEKCQYKCRHCYFAELGTCASSMDRNVLYEIVERFISESKNRGVFPRIDFTGGDPLLYDGIAEILKFSTNSGAICGLKCNPDLLLSDRQSIYDALSYCDSVSLSLDGRASFHDSLRGKGTFDKVITAVRFANSSNLRVRLSSTVSKDNISEIVPLLRYLAELEIVVDAYNWARYWSFDNPNHIIKMSDMLQLFADCSRFLEEYLSCENSYYTPRGEHGPKPRISFAFKEHTWFPFLVENDAIDLNRVKSLYLKENCLNCSARANTVVVDVDGMMYSCRKATSPLSSLGEVFDNKEGQNLPQQKHCKHCLYSNVCYGCPSVDVILREDCPFYTPLNRSRTIFEVRRKLRR